MRSEAIGQGDAGAYMVLYALLAVALFTLAAVVLDVGALRQGRRSDRAAADLSATAAAGVLDPFDASTYPAACQAAWDYVVLNRDDAQGAVAPPDCATTFASPCDPAIAQTAIGTYGPLTVSITYPVPASDALMNSEVPGGDLPQVASSAFDGDPCQRVAVRIVRDRRFLFGGLTGSDTGHTDVHAVARAGFTAPSVVIPAVVGLEPTGCDGVSTTPEGGTLAVSGAAVAGLIVVDSDASACAGFALNVPSPSSLTAGPTGRIESFALSGAGFGRAWSSPATVTPAPTPALQRLGRTFLDLRYDCSARCGRPQGELTALKARLGGPPGAPAPAGVTTYSGLCSVAAGEVIVVPGDVFVDCPVFQVDGSITFLGATTVFAGDVNLGAAGCLAVADATCGAVGVPTQDSIVFLRNGSLTKADKGDIVLPRTFVYAAGTLTIPRADPFGSSQLTWTAPLGGPYEDLLFWTDGTGDVLAGEQQTVLLEGTIAAPNATIVLEAKPGGTTQPLQVVGRRVRLQGSGTFTLAPSAGRATGKVTRLVKLVR